MSDRLIAEHVGVSANMVKNHRKPSPPEVTSTAHGAQLPPPRVGMDGIARVVPKRRAAIPTEAAKPAELASLAVVPTCPLIFSGQSGRSSSTMELVPIHVLIMAGRRKFSPR